MPDILASPSGTPRGVREVVPPGGTADPKLAALADAILIPPFTGTTPPDWILEALGRGLAGVTLFGPNVLGNVPALSAALRGACGIDPVIAIDEEGGDVTRLAYETGSPYPGNAALGVVDDVALTQEVYAAIGRDLAAAGINTDLAPCADVLATGGSSVVGTRSFGADPALAARHVAAAVAGLQAAGVAACAKHFPGHGSTAADSHRTLATITGTLDDIRARDLPPFRAAIAAGTWCLMPGHLRIPELTGDLPSTLSPAAVTGLLRGELGFTGVVICDALEMKAASAVHGIPKAAVLAAIAGVDLLCLGRDTDEAMYHAVRAALADAVTSGHLPAARLEESAARVAALRAKLTEARTTGTAAAPATITGGVGLLAARRALREAGPIPARLTDPLVVEVEPEENIAAGRFTWGFSPWTPVRRVHPAGGGASADDGAADNSAANDSADNSAANDTIAGNTAPDDTAADDIAADVDDIAAGLVAEAAGRSLVLAVRDASHALPLVTALLAARPDMILVEMGIPSWTPPEGTAYLTTYGASRACAQAAAEALGLA